MASTSESRQSARSVTFPESAEEATGRRARAILSRGPWNVDGGGFVYGNWLDAPVSDSRRGLDIVRVAVALIQVVHPLHGLWSGGKWGADVAGFGHFLGARGLPFGVFLAWSIIVLQVLSVVGLLIRRLVPVACVTLIAILATGIVLVHAEAGWFVVGAGEGGMEFSVLLIACLGGILWAHRPGGAAPAR